MLILEHNIHILNRLAACTGCTVRRSDNAKAAQLQVDALTSHSLDEYLVCSVRQFLLQQPLPRPNQTCIQHTMQFTTWSTLINTFIISTVALLSLIQAANAQASNYGPNHPDVAITSPNGVVPSSYFPGTQIDIGWYVPNRAGSHGQDRSLTASLSGTSPTKLHLFVPI